MALPQHGPVPYNNTSWGPSPRSERFAVSLPRPLQRFAKDKFKYGAHSKARLAQSANQCIAVINELEENAVGPPTAKSKYAYFLDNHPNMRAPEGDLPKYDRLATNKGKLMPSKVQAFFSSLPGPSKQEVQKEASQEQQSDLNAKLRMLMPKIGAGAVARSAILNPGSGMVERTAKACRTRSSAGLIPRSPVEKTSSPRQFSQAASSASDAEDVEFVDPFSDPHFVFHQKRAAIITSRGAVSCRSRRRVCEADPELEDSLQRVAQIGVTGAAALGYILQRRFGSLANSFAFFDVNGSGSISYSQWLAGISHLHLDCERGCEMSAEQLFKEIDQRNVKRISLPDLELACGGEKRSKKNLVSESSPTNANRTKLSSPFAIKVRTELQKMKGSGVHQREYSAKLTKLQRKIVFETAKDLGMWAFARKTNGNEKVVTVAHEPEFTALASQSLEQLNVRACKVFAQGLSRVQLLIIQALAAEHGLWCEWRLDPDGEDRQLVVHNLGSFAVAVRQRLLCLRVDKPAAFEEPLLDVEVEVVHAIANELKGFSVTSEGLENSVRVVVTCTSKFLCGARWELDGLDFNAEAFWEVDELTKEELECLKSLAKERNRTVEVKGKIIVVKAEISQDNGSAESESSGAESDSSTEALKLGARGLSPLPGYGFDTMASSSSLNRWNFIRRWPRDVVKKRKAAWKQFQNVAVRSRQGRFVVLDSFLQLCDELGLHETEEQEVATQVFNHAHECQDAQDREKPGLSFEFFWWALNSLAHETDWSKMALVRCVA